MAESRKAAPKAKRLSTRDLKKTRGGKTPLPGGPIPIPYPNEGGKK